MNFEYLPDGSIRLTQPHLIDQLISDLDLGDDWTTNPQTPTFATKILQRFEHDLPFDGPFEYRSVIGKLNFLEKSTRPDIAYAVHQCARFASDPKKSHGEAVKRIVKYLKGTRDQGLIFKPDATKSFECYVDADFCGNWNRETAEHDASTAKSRTGYVVTFAGCPVIWTSKLQAQIALSTTEAEYIALSQSLRDVIPMMQLLREVREQGYTTCSAVPRVHCKCFEDNAGALELAKTPKMRPRTKHINLTYHHFRDHVRNGDIKLYPISSNDQIADIFTKPLAQNLFLKLRSKLLKW